MARTTTNLSCLSLVEQVHSIANLGLQSVWLIRKLCLRMWRRLCAILIQTTNYESCAKKIASLKMNWKKVLINLNNYFKMCLRNCHLSEKRSKKFSLLFKKKIILIIMYFCATLKINILWLNLRSNFTKLKCPKFHQF